MNHKRKLRNTKRKNTNRPINIILDRSTKRSTRNRKRLSPRNETNTTTNISPGAASTRTKTSIGTTQTTTGRGGVRNVPAQLVTNRVPGDGKVEIAPKTDLVGVSDRTIGIGLLTIGPLANTTNTINTIDTIGMNALGTTGTRATPAIADEQQVTNRTGGMFSLFFNSCVYLKHQPLSI